MDGRRIGKTAAQVEATKSAQKMGKRVVWATFDQPATATLLAKHGALSEIVGDKFVIPHFRSNDVVLLPDDETQ